MKGVDVLLKAIAELNALGLKTTCTVVGDGPLKEQLQETAQTLGVAGQTVFAGVCADPADYLKKASFFVLPSRSEGMPNVLLEAMACGLPIIATSVGGIPDIIRDGCNGLVIAPDDVPALRLALTSLMTDHDLVRRLGKQARKDAEEHFSIDKVADAYLSLYQTITTQNN
jgi:glycosyltransferase involved in cell wall biosynthesis